MGVACAGWLCCHVGGSAREAYFFLVDRAELARSVAFCSSVIQTLRNLSFHGPDILEDPVNVEMRSEKQRTCYQESTHSS